MRPVSGLDRPSLQWTFVALGAVLVAVTVAEAVVIRRTRAVLDASHVAEMNARLDRQQLEIELTHERATREALATDAARLRGSAAAAPPTLTLTPLTRRGAAPPPPSVESPARDQVIELRLMLPRDTALDPGDFTIAIRKWSSGEPVWTRGGVRPSAADNRRAITTLVTGDALVAGAYEILLTAVTAPGQSSQVAAYEVSIAPPKR